MAVAQQPAEPPNADAKAPGGLRLMVYDDTCRRTALVFNNGRPGLVSPLTYSWMAGQAFYQALGRLDGAVGVRSWADALDWLATVHPGRTIDEIQYWGHGKWGEVRVDREVLDAGVLDPLHPLHEPLCAVRDRLSGPDALWWFRTCETFGGHKGQSFAQQWTTFMNCRAAGHTFIIGPWQSGLHLLRPGETPTWSPTEGIREGTPEQPTRAWWSKPWSPNTIHCLQGAVPEGF